MEQSILFRKLSDLQTEKPHHALLRSTALISVAPIMMLVILVLFKELNLLTALYAGTFIFIMSIIFVKPYVTNLAALTDYVKRLARDEKAEAPDLTFLNNVEELTEAVQVLHISWEQRRRQLEATIAESRILIDSLPDIIIMLNASGKVIRTNKTAKLLFGGTRYHDMLTSIVASPQIVEALQHVEATGSGETVLYSLETPIARHFMVRIERFPPLSPGDIHAIIVMHDITTLKHTEQVLSDFVANASHEIRTPLTSIAGMIETLQESAKDDPKAREEFLSVMEQQARRMTRLVNGLLSLSQIEKNIHTPPRDHVHIARVIDQVMEQQEEYAQDKKITLHQDVTSSLPVIIGDQDEISFMIENIVNNAIKYSPEKTEIRVKAVETANRFKERAPGLQDVEQLVMISIKDQGIGIKKEHIPRLTERFFRVDSSRSRAVQGTGLGLAIVKHVLERHGGILDIKSTPDEGSTFTLYLPVREG